MFEDYLTHAISDIFLTKCVYKSSICVMLYALERLSNAYFVRCAIKIRKPILSILYLLFVSTTSSNVISVLKGQRLEIFEMNMNIPVIIISWILYNFFPSDGFFKATKVMHPFFEVYYAFRDAIILCVVIDTASYLYPRNIILVFVTSFLAVLLVHIVNALLCTYLKQHVANIGPKMFITVINAIAYYIFTDYAHISNRFWFDKEDMKIYIICISETFVLIRLLIKNYKNYKIRKNKNE